MLDPIADRLYILAVLIGLALRAIIPWWLVVVLVGAGAADRPARAAAATRGYTALPVHFLGKAATFCLLYAFPLVLLGAGGRSGGRWLARVLGWAFAIWGTGLYWYAGLAVPRPDGAPAAHASRASPGHARSDVASVSRSCST